MVEEQFQGTGRWGEDWTAEPTGQYGLLHHTTEPIDAVEVYLPLITEQVACYCWATPEGVVPPAGGCRPAGGLGMRGADASEWASVRQGLMRGWYDAGNHPHAYLDRMIADGGNGITWVVGRLHRGLRLTDLR